MSESFKHSVKSRSSETMAMAVTYSGHQKCESTHRWGKGIRDRYILHLVLSGKGTYITPEGEFSLSRGDIFLIRPFTEIEYYADSSEPWEYYWVNFIGDDAEYLLKKTDFKPDCPVMRGCSEEIYSAMKNIVNNPASKRYENIELTGRLYILLSLLIKASSETIPYSKSEEDKKRILKAARAYIGTNYPLPISVDDISKAINISRSTLFRIFKSELNISPTDYLISYRITQAKRLLTETDLSVTAVARSVGYEDNLYFSRAFKKKSGVSPSEFKKAQAEGLQQKSI